MGAARALLERWRETHRRAAFALGLDLLQHDSHSRQFSIHRPDDHVHVFPGGFRRSGLCAEQREGLPESTTADLSCAWTGKRGRVGGGSGGAHLDTTRAAADRRALTAKECVSSATAERIKPASSVKTVTELDFLLTPSTCRGRTLPVGERERGPVAPAGTPTHPAVGGESRLRSLAGLQEFGPRHPPLLRLVRHGAPSRHVILSPGIQTVHAVCRRVENTSPPTFVSVFGCCFFTSTTFPLFSCTWSKLASPLFRFLMAAGSLQ